MTDQEERRPTLHVIAGPNGSGKTTLYENRIRAVTIGAEFVNADRLAQERFGHPAETLAESQEGQRLADARRAQLMAERRSLVTESTFSHPSKLDLIREAKAAGYAVTLYHVHVRSPEISVGRVRARVEEGGHPVPENKIRERYERNQALIRDAALLADRAYVFDNSVLNQPHRRVLTFDKGEVAKVAENVPAWATRLYAKELEAYSPSRLNRPAASFADAGRIAKAALGEDAKLYVAKAKGRYQGPVIGESDLHVIQRIGPAAAVAHFADRLDRRPVRGEPLVITYAGRGPAAVRPEREKPPVPLTPEEARARAFLTLSRDEALAAGDPALATAHRELARVQAGAAHALRDNPDGQTRMVEEARQRIAAHLRAGKTLREVEGPGPGKEPAPARVERSVRGDREL